VRGGEGREGGDRREREGREKGKGGEGFCRTNQNMAATAVVYNARDNCPKALINTLAVTWAFVFNVSGLFSGQYDCSCVLI